MAGGNNWQYLPPLGIGQPGTNWEWNGTPDVIPFRDLLDAERAQIGGLRVPSAEYPDGYLVTPESRRSDRLLDNVKIAAGRKDTDRGVHAGEKIDPRDYFWPADVGGMSGLQRQAHGVVQSTGTVASPRQTPVGTTLEQLIVNDRTLPSSPRGEPTMPRASVMENREALRLLLPDWSVNVA